MYVCVCVCVGGWGSRERVEVNMLTCVVIYSQSLHSFHNVFEYMRMLREGSTPYTLVSLSLEPKWQPFNLVQTSRI